MDCSSFATGRLGFESSRSSSSFSRSQSMHSSRKSASSAGCGWVSYKYQNTLHFPLKELPAVPLRAVEEMYAALLESTYSTISLHRDIRRLEVPGIFATLSMIPLTIFAVLALGITAKKGLNWVRRLLKSSTLFSCVRRSERFEIPAL